MSNYIIVVCFVNAGLDQNLRKTWKRMHQLVLDLCSWFVVVLVDAYRVRAS